MSFSFSSTSGPDPSSSETTMVPEAFLLVKKIGKQKTQGLQGSDP